MNTISLMGYALKRLWSRRLLSALLLLSTAVTIAMLVCIPAFSGAVGRRMVQEEFGYAEDGYARPPFTVLFYARGSARQPLSLEDLIDRQAWLESMMRNRAGLPPAESYLLTTSPREYLMAPLADFPKGDREVANASIITGVGLAEQVVVHDGEPFGAPSDDRLNVWMVREMAEELAVQVGDRYTYGSAHGPDEGRIPVRIAGIWEPLDPRANCWDADPAWHYDHRLLTSPTDFARFVSSHYVAKSNYSFWYMVIAQERVNLDRSDTYADRLEEIGREVEKRLPAGVMEKGLVARLARGHARKQALSWTLLGISLPLLAILLCFLGAVSGLLNRMQAQEIAMLISRGSRVVQVLMIALFESLAISAMALPLGIVLGLAMARGLGASAGFLRFVPRAPLPVTLASVNWWLVGAGLLVVVATRLVLSIRASRHSIVSQQREAARPSRGDTLMSWFWMLLLGAATGYAYYRLWQVGSMSMLSEGDGTHLADPILLVAPSLFLLWVPMLVSALYTLALRPLGWFSSRARRIGAYLAMHDLGREGRQYGPAVYMLTLCLAFGVYAASLALSAEQWLVDRRRYEVGADLVLVPETVAERAARMGVSVQEARAMAWDSGVVPVSEYERVAGIARAAMVGEYEAAVRVGSLLEPVTLLGVDRLRLPEVIYFRDDYAQASVGELMNLLGAAGDGLLAPRGFALEHQLEVGQPVRVTIVVDPAAPNPTKATLDLEIVALFDYFPTMIDPHKGPVLVADLNYLQVQSAGFLSHGIWMRLDPGVDSLEALEAIPGPLRAPEEKTHDAVARIRRDASLLERVGILGLLSMAFATGAVLSALGLALQSATAQQRRALRFAVLQVLGLDRPRLVAAMLIEYTLTLLGALASGTAVGVAASYLYVPLVHLGGVEGLPIPPYRPIVDLPMAALLAMGLLAVLIMVERLVLALVLRARVFEVLRMGLSE